MQQMHPDTCSELRSTSTIGRRFWAIIMGAASLGLFVVGVLAMLDVAGTYGDAFGGGWGLLWIVVAGLALLLGAGAVVMWNPPRSSSISLALFWIAGIAIVVYGGFFFLVGP